jgi:hypothetical protein
MRFLVIPSHRRKIVGLRRLTKWKVSKRNHTEEKNASPITSKKKTGPGRVAPTGPMDFFRGVKPAGYEERLLIIPHGISGLLRPKETPSGPTVGLAVETPLRKPRANLLRETRSGSRCVGLRPPRPITQKPSPRHQFTATRPGRSAAAY